MRHLLFPRSQECRKSLTSAGPPKRVGRGARATASVGVFLRIARHERESSRCFTSVHPNRNAMYPPALWVWQSGNVGPCRTLSTCILFRKEDPPKKRHTRVPLFLQLRYRCRATWSDDCFFSLEISRQRACRVSLEVHWSHVCIHRAI